MYHGFISGFATSYCDDDTVRTWFRLYSEEGTEGLAGFGYEGRDGHLKARQRDQLIWLRQVNTLPTDEAVKCGAACGLLAARSRAAVSGAGF